MAAFFNTAPQRIDARVLAGAAGPNGDYIRKGVKGILSGAKQQGQDEYTNANKDLLNSGSISDLLKIDQSRLTPEAAKGITGKLNLLNAQRAQEQFDWKKNDRAALNALSNAQVKGKQNVFADLNQSSLMPKYDAMSLTPDEVKATEGIDITNVDATTKALKDKPQMLASVLQKAKAQTELSNIADAQGRQETRYEQYMRNIQEVRDKGYTPTPTMVKRGDELKALDVQERATKQKGLQSQINSLEKVQLKAKQDKAKAQDKGSGYGTKGSSKTYTGSGVPFKEAIADIKSYVSPLGIGIDSTRVDDWVTKLGKEGYSLDKQRYMLDQMKEYGLFGNNINPVDSAAGQKEAALFSAEYDKKYGKKGGYGKSQVVNLSNEIITQTDNQLKELRKRMVALGMTPEEAQTARNRSKILDINTNIPKVEKFNSGKKGPDGDVKINDISKKTTAPITNLDEQNAGFAGFGESQQQADNPSTPMTPLEQAIVAREKQKQQEELQKQLQDKVNTKKLSERLKQIVNPTGSGGQDPLNLKGAQAEIDWLKNKLGVTTISTPTLNIAPRGLQSGLFSQQPASRYRNKLLPIPQLTPARMEGIAKMSKQEQEKIYQGLNEVDKRLLVQYLQNK